MTEQEIVKLTMIFQQLCDFEEEAHTGLDVIEDVAQWLAEQVADVDGQCQVRRPSSAEPVPCGVEKVCHPTDPYCIWPSCKGEPMPPSPSQAAVLGLVEALEEFLAAEEIVTKFENNELHADDETDPNDAYQRLEEARTAGREALSRYRATPGQG